LYLNQRKVRSDACDNWEAGQSLLINRSVHAAVIENGGRQMLAEGLAYDRCSVGIVTDVAGFEALSDFDIRTPEQMFNVVRTQVDVVLPDGYAVLNAEDYQAVEMAELSDGDVIFYGTAESLPAIVAHREDGGRAVFSRGGDIVLAHGSIETAVLPCSIYVAGTGIPAQSVLAAVAAAWALGISPELICAGMRTFGAQGAAAASRH
jgi:cyanophycin synthetase